MGVAISRFNVEKHGVLSAHRCGDDTYFVVVFTERANVETVTQNMLRAIARIPKSMGTAGLNVTASAGIAEWWSGESVLSWFERAYRACEISRENGGNQFSYNRTEERRSWS
jgi:GGDEF domain-containing protein